MDPYYPPNQFAPPQRNHSPLIVLLLIGIAALLVWRFFINHGTPAVDPRPVAPRGDLATDEQSTIDLFKEASPSVVFITTAQRVEFWNRNPQDIPQGAGSGFIWDNAGHIVTNFHVVQPMLAANASAPVPLSDHTTYTASLVGVSADNDLA